MMNALEKMGLDVSVSINPFGDEKDSVLFYYDTSKEDSALKYGIIKLCKVRIKVITRSDIVIPMRPFGVWA